MAGADGSPAQSGKLQRSQNLRLNTGSIDPVGVVKFVAHSARVLRLAHAHGWKPGARYTNLRDVRQVPFEGNGFLDIHWQKYDFEAHLRAVAHTRPMMTVARDIVDIRQLDKTLREAEQLAKHSKHVIVVPKDKRLAKKIEQLIPGGFLLGYSVPTRYGGTEIDPRHFTRPVHLLGGRPDHQRRLANEMPVVSVDCNRFTLDAGFGDFFDGARFRPHPKGGYEQCLKDSIRNIDALWGDYQFVDPRWSGRDGNDGR